MAIQFLRGKTAEINQATTVNLQPGQPLLDTTKGCLYINADPDDTAKKVSNPSAFTKFPSLKGTTKGFVKYDGTNYTTTTNVVESIGGASGTIQLGSGLTLTGTTLSATNTSVKSVTSISNEYQATDVEGNLTDSGWTSNASEAGFSATKKYLYVRQTIAYSDHTSDVNTFINSVWGANGKDGTSVTILSPKYDSLEEFNSATDKKEEPGAAYLVAGDLWVWTLGQSGNPGSWQNVGRIQGPQGPKGDKGDAGATGTGATITFKYLASTSALPNVESSDWDDDLRVARGKLSESNPILWCQEIVNDAAGKSGKIYILETLPYKTYTRYADIGAFDTTSFEPIGTPDIYDTPKSTTGWMGTYSGYAQTAPTSYSRYKWAYYLTEINRTNFMANVLDTNIGKDGIYKYTDSVDGGTEYIGINASAINTGSLKVTDGTDTLFDANITEKKVNIAGWNISKDQISKNGVGLYSGTTSAEASPARFFAGCKEITSIYIGVLDGGETFTMRQTIDGSYIDGIEIFNGYIKINLGTSFGAVGDKMRLNSVESTTTYTLTSDLNKITGSGGVWEPELFCIAAQDEKWAMYLSTDTASDWYRFKVLEDGSLHASAASIEGNIKATSGKIGNCIISADGTITSANGKFVVSSEGNLTAQEGYIGSQENGFKITEKAIKHGPDSLSSRAKGVYIGTDGILLNGNSSFCKLDTGGGVDVTSIDGYDFGTKQHYSSIKNGLYGSSTDGLHIQSYEGKPIYIGALSNDGYNVYGTRLELQYETSYLKGTWETDSGTINTSSRNKKHDIEELDDRYSTLLDHLKPVRFKYNDGTSDRYHTGLILDEMKDAMDAADIDTSELAAYCVQDEKTGDGGIRYGELIALLIKEVQELKKKIR